MRVAGLWSVLALMSWLGASAAGAAHAQAPGTGTVYLKNGGFVRGELIELQPGTLVRLKLADGSVRELAWSEVERVDDPSLPPAPPSAAAAAPPTVAASPAASELSLTAPEPGNAAEIARLRAEYDAISNTGPIVMMILGGASFALFGGTGAVLLAVGEVCDSPSYEGEFGDERDCRGVRVLGGVLAVAGVVGAVVGVWGLVKVIKNSERRVALSNRISDLKQDQASLSLDLLPRRDGATLALSLRL